MGNYEVIVAGAGHNGLIAAGYLAKAGAKVLVVEAKPWIGGGVVSREVAAPGFKTDMASVCHVFIQANPLIREDELDLKSKYGLKYIYPEHHNATVFPDDRAIIFSRSLDATCDSIAQFSSHDAEAYYKFAAWGRQYFDMTIAGLFGPSPSFGTLNSMLETSAEGREMMRIMYLSAHDVAMEWFEDPHTINTVDRLTSEAMQDPRLDGSGMNLLLSIPLAHEFGWGLCVGGSGGLSEAVERSIIDRGGEIRTNAQVREFKVSGGRCTGVILEDGEEITATKAVITNFHIRQLDQKMLGAATALPEEYTHNITRVRWPDFQAFHQGFALHEAPDYKAGEEVNNTFNVEFLPDTLRGLNEAWDDYRNGLVRDDMPLCVTATRWDPTRAPEGKHTQYLYHYEPYNLAEGAAHWDEIRDEVADRILSQYASRCNNMGASNIIGRWTESPLDFERDNLSWPQGNFTHIGTHISHQFGLRPFPLVADYRLPVEGLYLCGPSAAPGPSVIGGGRPTAVAVMNDLGIDFEAVVG